MPFIGASVFASIVGWVVDSLLESWAPIYMRIMVGLVGSGAAFYWARAKLLELRP
jgi:uncharacterized membrane protein YeaQ/YmgE (transglycosylase-associated protein family)